MASANETVLLKSTLEIQNKPYSVKLTSSEIYWEVITPARATSGPYSEPLVIRNGQDGSASKSPSLHPGSARVGDLQTISNSQNQNSNKKRGTGEWDCETELHSPPPRSPAVDPREACLFFPMNVSPSVGIGLLKTNNKYKVQNGNCKSCTRCVRPKTENQTVRLCEILACRLDSKASGTEGKFQHLEMVALNATAFSIHVVKRISKHRWRERKVTFRSKDTSVIQQWVDKIQEILQKPEFNRPKHLLVFINPFGGRKRGVKIFHEKVAPLFDLAGITTEVVVTQRANHARDSLLEYDLTKTDGVVSVGGDGMFSEILHGLLTRTMREAGMEHLPPGTAPVTPNLRVGIIPGGSTDTVAWSTTGVNDPITSALHIAIGDQIAMDIATVHHGNQFLKYNMSMLAYGYFGDCLVDSESNRWMGPKRYDWAGVKKLLGNRVYEGEVSFLPSSDRDNNPRDGTRCRAGCQVCQAIPLPEGGCHPGGELSGGEREGWQKIKGRFLAINAFTISCKSHLATEGPAWCAHLGDGCQDLVLIHECSRTDYSNHLLRTMSKKKDHLDFPFIQTFRVREFQFRPLVDDVEDTHDTGEAKSDGAQRLRSRMSHNSVWNCDGEIIEEPSLDIRTYRQVLKLFARGIEEEIREETTCLNCASQS